MKNSFSLFFDFLTEYSSWTIIGGSIEIFKIEIKSSFFERSYTVSCSLWSFYKAEFIISFLWWLESFLYFLKAWKYLAHKWYQHIGVNFLCFVFIQWSSATRSSALRPRQLLRNNLYKLMHPKCRNWPTKN